MERHPGDRDKESQPKQRLVREDVVSGGGGVTGDHEAAENEHLTV